MACNEVLTPTESEHHISVHRSRGQIVCCVWWNLRNFFNLKPGAIYLCPLDSTKALCCPDWMLGFKIYESSVIVSLQTKAENREVSISLITQGHKTPFVITAGKEYSAGTYGCMVPRAVLESYFQQVADSTFIVMCRLVLDDQDMARLDSASGSSCVSLARDLETIFVSQKFADIRLVQGQTEFPVHKCFLSARSRSFGQALMKDCFAQKGRFLLQYDSSISNGAIVEALRYIYTGRTADLVPELAVPLYHVAEAFELDELREICMRFLLRNITVPSFTMVLNLALITKSKHLIEKAGLFFIENRKSIMREFFSRDGKFMIRPSWIKPQEHLILEMEIRRLARMNMTSLFFDTD